MLKLKRLSVKKHPMLDGPVDLHFSDGENILVGINGSGKTTLLELIKCCLRGDFSQFKDSNSEIELAYQLFYPGSHIDVEYKLIMPQVNYISDQMPDFNSSAVNKLLEDKARPEHFLKMNITTKGNIYTLTLEKGTLKIEDKDGSVFDNSTIDVKNYSLYISVIINFWGDFSKMPEQLRVKRESLLKLFFNLNIEYLKLNRFPEGLDFYYYLKEESVLGIETIRNNSSNTQLSLPSFFKEYELTNNMVKDNGERDLIVSSKELPILKEIKKELALHSMKLSFKYNSKKKVAGEIKTTWQGFKLIIDIDDDTTITDDKLSYGEKRFASLMLYLEGCGDVIILDEPINGLHHNLIDKVVDEIYSGERQSFIANQNSILFDYINFNSVDDVRKKLILCNKKDKKMHWRNPTDDEAKEFFAEVEVDFMHISEILRMKNLW